MEATVTSSPKIEYTAVALDSTEIKKLINLIYSAKPENALDYDLPMMHHDDEVIQQIDTLLVKLKEQSVS